MPGDAIHEKKLQGTKGKFNTRGRTGEYTITQARRPIVLPGREMKGPKRLLVD
jgi:hypothetical protein